MYNQIALRLQQIATTKLFLVACFCCHLSKLRVIYKKIFLLCLETLGKQWGVIAKCRNVFTVYIRSHVSAFSLHHILWQILIAKIHSQLISNLIRQKLCRMLRWPRTDAQMLIWMALFTFRERMLLCFLECRLWPEISEGGGRWDPSTWSESKQRGPLCGDSWGETRVSGATCQTTHGLSC